MNATMEHRGPDDQGTRFLDQGEVWVGLGHRRLSIIDLSDAGSQPMRDSSGSLWVVHNGEIYNYRELRAVLEKSGHRFRSATDTEVILAAYREWGADCVDRLQGMFAFAVWDSEEKRLFMARDRVGIKPLYYAETRDGLVFASEMKALIEDPEVQRSVDPAAVDQYLSFGYVPAPHSILKTVRKLPPGNRAIWHEGRLLVEPYWRFSPVDDTGDGGRTENEWLEEFDAVFERVVAKQMVSDVPLGAFLSGGIDSSLVVWMMSRTSKIPVKTFTVAFGERNWSEAPFASLVADQFGTDHEEFTVEPESFGILPKLVWHLDEPFGDSSLLPTYYVSKMTRQKVTVALSGDGGDELFAGYTRYQGERLSRVFQRIPSALRSSIVTLLGTSPWTRHASSRRLRDVLQNAGLDFAERYRNKQSIGRRSLRSVVYSDDFRAAIALADDGDQIDEILEGVSAEGFIERLTALDTLFYLPNDMLTKVDRMSMASSLEVRVPFLDEEIVDFSRRVPVRFKLNGMTTKYLLRRLAARALPADIWKRGKQGFGVPVQAWFRGDLLGKAREILNDSRTLERGYLDASGIDRVLSEHQSGLADHGHFIFALMAFELWHRIFLDGDGA